MTSKPKTITGKWAAWNITIFAEEERLKFIALDQYKSLECYKELCPKTGKVHWQSCVEFTNRGRKSFGSLKKILPTAHIEAWINGKKGTPQELFEYLRDYCKKGSQSHNEWNVDNVDGLNYGKDLDPEGVSLEKESDKSNQGARSDIGPEVKDLIQAHQSMRNVFNDHALMEVCMKYTQWVERVFAAKPPEPMMEFFPREYHLKAMEWLMRPHEEPSLANIGGDRQQLLWLWEETGNTSKTMFLKYLVSNHDALLMSNTDKENAMRYQGQPIIVMDVPRQRMDRLNFGIIEQLLNGFLNSDKYFPITKCYQKMPRCIIVANCPFPENSTKTTYNGVGDPIHEDTAGGNTLSLDRVICTKITKESKKLLGTVWGPDEWKYQEPKIVDPVLTDTGVTYEEVEHTMTCVICKQDAFCYCSECKVATCQIHINCDKHMMEEAEPTQGRKRPLADAFDEEYEEEQTLFSCLDLPDMNTLL